MIKATALRDMQGNWLKAFLLSLIESAAAVWVISYLPFVLPAEDEILAAGGDATRILATMLPKEITPKMIMSIGVTVLLYLFVMTPFSIGMSKYFLKAARGERGTFRDVFSVYANIRTVLSSILLTLITLLFSVLSFVVFMIIPVGLMIVAVLNQSLILYNIADILLIAFTLFFIVWISRYRFISYIYANDEKGAFAAIYKYFKLMKKRNGECLVLGASYFGWMLMISFMPVLLFVYQCLSSTVYAKYLYRFRGELSFGEFETQTPPPQENEENKNQDF